MPTSPSRIALLGNPNTGKTSLFNELTGFRARVGNYAGVTVERKAGAVRGSSEALTVIDLPGTYSVAARSPDEMVAIDVLLGRRADEPRPDAVLVVLDASNLERNLFLASQVLDCGLPTAFVLNMVDVARQGGIEVDAKALGERFGVRVFPTVASRREGIPELIAALPEVVRSAPPPPRPLDPAFEAEAETLHAEVVSAGVPDKTVPLFLVRRALLENEGMAEQQLRAAAGDSFARALDRARARCAEKGIRLLSLEARSRYGAIREALAGAMTRPDLPASTFSDRVDAVLIHKVWGTACFALLMLVVFQAIYQWSAPAMDAIDGLFGSLSGLVDGALQDGPLRSFLSEGVIAGVGGVLVFLPQIMVLFFFLAVLEDCGYMARAAFLMDRLLSRAGLSGRSFIPMLSSFACAIPGIMATRTIEDRRDRFTTILVAPLMSCSARLPVYTLLIGAFIPKTTVLGLSLQGLTLLGMYAVGVLVAVGVALLLKRTLFKGSTPTFIMELPPYRMPVWKNVLFRMGDRALAFLLRAGTTIFAVSVVIWALTYYPRPQALADEVAEQYRPKIELLKLARESAEDPALVDEQIAAAEDARDRAIQGAYLRQSFLGRAGRLIEPVVRPLGWDWKIGMAALASFPAREVVVSTLGIIYDLGGEAADDDADLRETLRAVRDAQGRPVFNIPVALGIMVFFALCAQCAATLAVVWRETNDWRWPVFCFCYMTGLAYLGALVTYQIGIRLLGGGG